MIYLRTIADPHQNMRSTQEVKEGNIVAQIKNTSIITCDDCYRRFLGTAFWIFCSAQGSEGWMRADLLRETVLPSLDWPYAYQMACLHGSANPAMAYYDDQAWKAIADCAMKGLKFIANADIDGSAVNRARSLGYQAFEGRIMNVLTNQAKDGATYCAEVADAILRLYQAEVRYFEVHNEPNLIREGYGLYDPVTKAGWRNATEFAIFLRQALGFLRPRFREAKLGLPALSPGPTVAGVRFDSVKFWTELMTTGVMEEFDWVAYHVYWDDMTGDYIRAAHQVAEFCAAIPNKGVMVTEFSNANPKIDKVTKGDQYVKFFKLLQSLGIPNLYASFLYVLRWDNDQFGEQIMNTPIPEILRKGLSS